jgi:predicted nucleotidyltransferase component of viral defense system
VTRELRNITASVHDRLLRHAHSRGEDFQLVLQRYAMERLLFRLAQSRHKDRFVVKGAVLYIAWGVQTYRPTRDLDLLGYGPSDQETLTAYFRELCAVEVFPDGLLFLPDSVQAQEIRGGVEYGGIRIRIDVRLETARINVQVDVAFGDVIVPTSEEVEFPTLLPGPAPHVRIYSRESVIAEKLHAAAVLGETNTRLKDFYDLFTLPRLFPFEGSTLTQAIAATFERRRMALPAAIPLRPAFFDDKARAGRWRAYLERNGLTTAPRDFTAAGESVREFLTPPYRALIAGVDFLASWQPEGPWT